jgi:predicted Zn-dependent peptidase
LINNQSVQSAKYANPTEFDKLIKSIGGTGLNAFTATDMTVYHNAFPGEQVEKWVELYAHRFHKPVFRSFQSELEVVYEEKNKGMDNPYQSLYEEVNKKLFKYKF